MKRIKFVAQDLISQVAEHSWKSELEKASQKYHLVACWAAIIFDPIFAITDYINIPEHWQLVFALRLAISGIILTALLAGRRAGWSTHFIVSVPFITISLQNAFTYSLIGPEDIIGHTLNYIALLIGASMFVLWRWTYSVVMIVLSTIATAWFLSLNSFISIESFFLNGGLLLIAVGIFMAILIQTRYNLTVKEIKARLALSASNEEIQSQAREIESINANLEGLVQKRTAELEKKNKALEEYAFINAHKLRSPVASLLGLINLMSKTEMKDEGRHIMEHMSDSADKLDKIVHTITKAIEQGDEEMMRRP